MDWAALALHFSMPKCESWMTSNMWLPNDMGTTKRSPINITPSRAGNLCRTLQYSRRHDFRFLIVLGHPDVKTDIRSCSSGSLPVSLWSSSIRVVEHAVMGFSSYTIHLSSRYCSAGSTVALDNVSLLSSLALNTQVIRMAVDVAAFSAGEVG